MKKVYSLKKHSNTGELHIFEGTSTGDSRCSLERTSRCGRVNLNDVDSPSILACASASSMRLRCAEIGADVCGQCVATLYSPFDGEE